jgi:molecular chaperone GrpE (heat shock protein)
MECVETREGEDWKVLEETRSGYKFGDMILRPALVVVGKKGDAETSSA